MTDGVWVVEDPPKSDDEVMWLAATITDHVCAALPRRVYNDFRHALDSREGG